MKAPDYKENRQPSCYLGLLFCSYADIYHTTISNAFHIVISVWRATLLALSQRQWHVRTRV